MSLLHFSLLFLALSIQSLVIVLLCLPHAFFSAQTAACQLSNGKPLAAAGDANGGLTFVDGNLELVYWHSPKGEEKRCHGKFVRSTRVIFKCDRSQDNGPVGSGPEMLSEQPDCQYVVEWYTPLACNPSFHEAPCTVSDDQTGQVRDSGY